MPRTPRECYIVSQLSSCSIPFGTRRSRIHIPSPRLTEELALPWTISLALCARARQINRDLPNSLDEDLGRGRFTERDGFLAPRADKDRVGCFVSPLHNDHCAGREAAPVDEPEKRRLLIRNARDAMAFPHLTGGEARTGG